MEVSLKIKLLYYWYITFGKNNRQNPLIKISKKGKGVKSVLFLLPAEKKYAQLAGHFIKKDDKKGKKYYSYLLHQDSIGYYQNYLLDNSFIITENNLNWFGALNSKKIINSINNVNFDAVVDLNISSDQSLSLIINRLDIPIRVGFDNFFSTLLYSITIEPKTIGFMEENYLMIEKILGLE
tara:strand:- start:541 stop:1083 length:543 start_codon:yes stop_codon:yes gene_type:complete